MHFIDKGSESLQRLGQAVTEASSRLFALVRLLCDRVEFDQLEDLYAEVEEPVLYFVESGVLEAMSDGRPIYSFEPGDLIGVQKLSHFPVPSIRALEPVKLLQIDLDTFRDAVASSAPFKEYLIHLSAFFGEACCQSPDLPAPRTSFKTFKEGQTIIHEGDPANEVYDLMTGSADVYVKGQKVGEVRTNEIFGAMAALTRTPRTASVVASSPCTVMSVPMEEFLGLIQSQPRTCLALLENMANQILELNSRLVDVMGKS